MDNNRVLMAMSGGVDSSVAALLLKNQGYEVIGVILNFTNNLQDTTENSTDTIESIMLTKIIANKLNIPLYVLEAKDIFFEEIITPFLTTYRSGQTPNPCVLCNIMRWRLFQDFCSTNGIKKIATGHYARINYDPNGKYELLKAIDSDKDQSYFLHRLKQRDLKRTIFPLGELLKRDVRNMAINYKLPTAQRSDSQDLCFLSGMNYRDYLKTHFPECNSPGVIKTTDGKTLGEHEGISYYTIGQRKGLAIQTPQPQYVIEINPYENSIIVGPRELLEKSNFIVNDINWISGDSPKSNFNSDIKIRYKSNYYPSNVIPINRNSARIESEEIITGISPGQSTVFYIDQICLGGGIIQ